MPVMAPPPARDRELSDQERLPEKEAVQTYAATREMAPALQNAFMNTIALKSASVPVLMNFHVEQNGSSIRVVDQDGSVYFGILRTAQHIATSSLGGNRELGIEDGQYKLTVTNSTDQSFGGVAGERNASAPPAAPDNNGLQQAQNMAQNNSPQSQQNYSFQVTGFNRTLKQNVQFTATLLGDIAAAQNAQATFGLKANAAWGAGLVQSMQQYKAGPLPWSNLCITGTAIVNGTNQIQVNATPVPPPPPTKTKL